MNDRLPEPLRAPTPFSTPRPDEPKRLRPPGPTGQVVSALDRTPATGDKTLAQLARESFEAGFAAGASNAPPSSTPRPDAAAAPVESTNDSDANLSDLVEALTPRRFEVLKLVARGLTNPEIASVLGLSANTIKAHMTGILETLEVTNRTEAAIALQDYEAAESQVMAR